MKLLTALRLACFVEAISALILFCVAMPLKHWGDMPHAVSWPGRIHGGLFLLVMALLVAAFSGEYLRLKLALWVLVGAIVPGVAFLVDPKLKAVQLAAKAAANEAGE